MLVFFLSCNVGLFLHLMAFRFIACSERPAPPQCCLGRKVSCFSWVPSLSVPGYLFVCLESQGNGTAGVSVESMGSFTADYKLNTWATFCFGLSLRAAGGVLGFEAARPVPRAPQILPDFSHVAFLGGMGSPLLASLWGVVLHDSSHKLPTLRLFWVTSSIFHLVASVWLCIFFFFGFAFS